MPSREAVLEFIATAPGKVGRREIARAFAIKGDDRVGLKQLLKEMSAEGLLNNTRKRIRGRARLLATALLEVIGTDAEGDLYGEPVDWDRDEEGVPPRVLIEAGGGGAAGDLASLGPGDRVLCRIEAMERGDGASSPSVMPAKAGTHGPGRSHHGGAVDPGLRRDDGGTGGGGTPYLYRARPIKKLERERRRLLGIYRADSRGRGGVIQPIDRKQLKEWRVEPGSEGGAEDGELVRLDIVRGGRMGLPQARIVERLGNPHDQRQISLIAVHSHGIPDTFPDRVLREVEALHELDRQGREDLTRLPLITIDPADARDHDDAVWGGPDPDPANPGGFLAVVAIADVACYVRPDTSLDREALKRGNSVYFPDRVVPMLPERISNDLCSLKEGELRPCLAVRMVFDRHGKKRSHTFVRGLMRSAAKLSYQQAQAAIDAGVPGGSGQRLTKDVLAPLWDVWRALEAARKERSPLELDLPERKIVLDAEGRVARVVVPERLAAHRLIEELMIQANVAAAETLEAKRTPLIYRVHDRPAEEKLAALREFLETIDVSLPKSGTIATAHFNRLLEGTRGRDIADLVSEVVLRSQSQAEYNPENYGHFGLHLGRYAHFTSPIRRYADLVVHRALIRALGLGRDGLTDEEIVRLSATAQAISDAERRAMAAERETTDRLIAAHLAGSIGAEFRARISGVTRSGLFVRLDETGADGFIAISTLGAEYFVHDETHNALVGERSGQAYRLGDRVEVRLVEAIPTAGALRFEMLSPGTTGALKGRGLRLGKRGRQGRRPRR